MTTLLVTGFPGFIARRLTPRLLRTGGVKLLLLHEPRLEREATKALNVIRKERPDAANRARLVPGDITLQRLGMTGAGYSRLCRKVERIFHLAAIYDLTVPREKAWLVNVEGTRSILKFAADCRRLSRLNYVSTAYVSGDRRGVILESELNCGQGFNNHYEETKFQAEADVRDAMSSLPATIYRPGIVVGDSKTGETDKFDGPYFPMVSALKGRLRFLPSPCPALLNTVPVDYIVEAISTLAKRPAGIGKTYHLCSPHHESWDDYFTALERMGLHRAWRLPPRLIEIFLRFGAAARYFGIPSQAVVYAHQARQYDTRNTARDLRGTNLRAPRFLDYLPVLVDFARSRINGAHSPLQRTA